MNVWYHKPLLVITIVSRASVINPFHSNGTNNFFNGIQLWGCTRQSNRNIIQRFQNRVLRGIVDVPWYIRKDNLHKDLDVATVDSVIKQYAQRHEQRLRRHINVEALQLLHDDGLVRRLQRTKPFELV
jgi:hypothetical protein